MPSFLNNFQFANPIKRLNRWVQVLLFLTLIGGLNYLGMHTFKRWDLTQNHRYSLSAETKAYLKELDEPIRIIVTIPQNSSREEERSLSLNVKALLDEYLYFSQSIKTGSIEIEYVDIYKNLQRAEVLAREIGLEQANSIVVQSENRTRFIRGDELLTFRNGKPLSFKGEAAITSAIIEVSRDESPVLYFLTGHGEMSPNSAEPVRGLSQFSNELRLRNFQIRTLDLNETISIPEDCDALVIADPQGPLLPAEVEIIRDYLSNRAGRLIAWISPRNSHGLNPLLYEWGIQTDSRVILETNQNYVESSGSFLIRNFAQHPITETLIQNQIFVLSGLARPVIPINTATIDERLVVTPLIASSNRSWAESNWREGDELSFTDGLDLLGPVPIGVIAERRASSQLGIKVPGGRVALFGAGDLFGNGRLSSLGNNTLIFNTLNWILDREFLLSIPPRELDTYILVASREQFRLIGLIFLTIPAAIALLGLTIYSIRKF